MAPNLSITAARAGTSLPLTTIAQGFRPQKPRVMSMMFPLVETGTYGGTVLSFDDSAYDEVQDDRADDTDYPEVQWGYEGLPYKLNTKGISTRIGDKRKIEMQNLRINWGQYATDLLMDKASLMHEIEAATIATTTGNYASTHRVTLTTGTQFSDASVDPMPAILTAKRAVSDAADENPNICIMGRDVYDALIVNPYIKEHVFHNTALNDRLSRAGIDPAKLAPAQIHEGLLASLFGVNRVVICEAKRKVSGVKTRVFGKHMVFAYTNPAGLDGTRLPYRTNSNITNVQPAVGYTFVMSGHPLMFQPVRDEMKKADVYMLDFDRKVTAIGVNASGAIVYGYLIANAVA